jgi:type III secretion protein L
MSELPTQPSRIILRADEAQAWADGFAFLQAAREQVEALRERALQEADQLRQQGYADGHRQGADAAAELLTQTHAAVDRYLAGLEGDLAKLALSVVRQLIDGLDDAERIARLTAKALTEFRDQQALTLHVAPEQVAAVQANLDALVGSRSPTVTADSQLVGAQATLASRSAVVDLDLDAQLEGLSKTLQPSSREVSA